LRLCNELPVPRTTEIDENLQGNNSKNGQKIESITEQEKNIIDQTCEAFYNENSNHLFPGVRHDYKEAVNKSLQTFDVKDKQETRKTMTRTATTSIISPGRRIDLHCRCRVFIAHQILAHYYCIVKQNFLRLMGGSSGSGIFNLVLAVLVLFNVSSFSGTFPT
jgi:hypothetical protein